MLTHIITDLPPQRSTSRTAYRMKRAREPKTDASPAIVESNTEAGDSSVKGIMDHCCLVEGTWHGHHDARVQQSTVVKGILTACCVLWAKQNLCHLTPIKCEKY